LCTSPIRVISFTDPLDGLALRNAYAKVISFLPPGHGVTGQATLAEVKAITTNKHIMAFILLFFFDVLV